MQERSPSTFPLRNVVLFVVLSFLVVTGHALVMNWLRPPAQRAADLQAKQEKEKEKVGKEKPEKVAAPAAKDGAGKKVEPKQEEAKPADKGEAEPKAKTPEKEPAAKAEKPPAEPAAEPKIARQWVTLGSADANDPYRMLVTLTNGGAALARIEMSSPRYLDLATQGAYLGHVVMEDDGLGKGAPVQVVGKGTPADKAGLKAGDRITGFAGRGVRDAAELDAALGTAKPNRGYELTVVREGKEQTLSVTLARRPLEVVRPERKEPQVYLSGPPIPDAVNPTENCPLSLLATLQQLDGDKIGDDDPAKLDLDRELKGVKLRNVNWEIDNGHDQEHVVFRRKLPGRDLEIRKTYRLAKIPDDAVDSDRQPARAYHLEFQIEIRNTGKEPRTLAYRLDGPNGLPNEGAWYASKVSHTWGQAGLRDVVAKRSHSNVFMQTCATVADKGLVPFEEQTEWPFVFMGVDAQYFSAVVVPGDDVVPDVERVVAVRLGDVDQQRTTATNTSFRLVTKPRKVEPGKSVTDSYTLFAGPKKPALLAEYDLGDLIYYGWPIWEYVARLMTQVLHILYYAVHNYGLAIIMLTVLVRLCMFPLSRKQALGAQKMQELQPEIKKLQEKYKKDREAMVRAQQELFRKHNYNPLSGCLPLFIQMPIFIGLYRSLQVDVELRGAPLISHAVRWCSNLAGPDMLWDWSRFMPDWFNSGIGMFALGPYFNVLPLVTIALFIVQQKMFMPPPADEQAAMQQKMMNFMMIFMGVMFYKVASGLCIYFIASSLWGVAERKILPKTAAASAGGDDGGPGPRRPFRTGPSSDGGGNGSRKNKKRTKK